MPGLMPVCCVAQAWHSAWSCACRCGVWPFCGYTNDCARPVPLPSRRTPATAPALVHPIVIRIVCLPVVGVGSWSLHSFHLWWRWIGFTADIVGPHLCDLAVRAPLGPHRLPRAMLLSTHGGVTRARIKFRASVDGVAASRHAGAERAVVVGASLRHRALLPRHVRLLLLLLLPHLLLLLLLETSTAHQAEQSAHGGADGRALARIAADGPAHRAERPTAQPALEGAAAKRRLLWRRVAGRGRRHGHARIRGIETRLLHGPSIALALVRLLLLRRLAARRIDVGLRRIHRS